MKLVKDLTEAEIRVIEEIRKYQEDNKYGNIQINFSSGRIMQLTLNESLKLSS